MTIIVHRTTKEVITSVKPADAALFDSALWLVGADLSAVGFVLPKYWIITGDVVTLMNQTERDAVDLAESNEKKDSLANLVDNVASYERAFALLLLDELNILRAAHSLPPRTVPQLKAALRAKLNV